MRPFLQNPITRGGISILIVVAIGCATTTEPMPPEPADVIFRGTVLTLVEDDSEAEALAIRGDRILAVGSLREVEAHRGERTRIVELGEGALLPGFIDAHGHLSLLASFEGYANVASPPVGPVEDIADLQEVLRRHIAGMDGPGWVVGSGYDESLLADGRHPTRADLDAVSPDRPILLAHVSMHLGVANSKALALAGIDAETPDPEAGVIRRGPDGHEPNGVLEEHAWFRVYGLVPARTPEEALADLERAQATYARYGFTTLQDGATSPEAWRLLAEAERRDLLVTDVLAYPSWMWAETILPEATSEDASLDRLRLAGVKLALDGSPQGKTAYLTQPYHVPPAGQGADYRGYPALSDEEVVAEVAKFDARGHQVMVHANGDAAIDQLIAAVEALERRDPGVDRRPILIHGQATRLDQLPDIARLRIVPSFFSAHTYFWGDWHRDSVLGPVRGERISPTASARDQGIRFTIHMDSPVLPPDAPRMIWATVNRRTRSGRVLGPEERIPVMAAIAATTRDAAHQSFDEARKGTLEAGKQADLVWVSRDPRAIPAEALADLEVVETWSRGRRIHPAATGP